MPGFDGTGPRGMGPLTGGGRGFCGMRVDPRAVYPRGRGVYPGLYNRMETANFGSVSYADDLDLLRNEVADLKDQLSEIKGMLNKLVSGK